MDQLSIVSYSARVVFLLNKLR